MTDISREKAVASAPGEPTKLEKLNEAEIAERRAAVARASDSATVRRRSDETHMLRLDQSRVMRIIVRCLKSNGMLADSDMDAVDLAALQASARLAGEPEL